MDGRASAPAAGTILNALATGTGSAFAIDAEVTATVSLTDADGAGDGSTNSLGTGDVRGAIGGAPDADARLIERCVELVVEGYGDGEGGTVETESEIPMAAGLKSSSAAANATVLATLDALGVGIEDGVTGSNGPSDDDDRDITGTDAAAVSRADAARIGVRAAREVGVTATGAFDDASASMLGGLTITDNTTDTILDRDEPAWDVLVWTPEETAFSADADVARCERVAPMADLVAELALDGRYERAMTVNGFAFCGALEFSTEPLVAALPNAEGVSLSGTGPSYVAVGERDALRKVQGAWGEYEGITWRTTTRAEGARVEPRG